jgi:signal peptidase II
MKNVVAVGITAQMWARMQNIRPSARAVKAICLEEAYHVIMLKCQLTKWLSISAIIVAIDLYTKYLTEQAFTFGEKLYVTSFFDLVRYHNEGAAFSFLADAGGWQKWFFTIISVVASIVILYLLKKHQTEKRFCVGLALVLGGALGNLYDRVTLGYVVDFLSFHVNELYWPAFNVADSAISIGVVILLLDGFIQKKDGESHA